jgi:phosphoglycerate dehydrogenase-like enzyme
MKLLIVVRQQLELWTAPGWFGERLAAEFPALEVVQRLSFDEVPRDLQEAEIIFTLALKHEQFAAARNLRWIQAPTAAIHQFLFPELVESEVVLTHASEVHGPVVAEHVMAVIFALAKKIPQAAVFQRQHIWGQMAMWSEGAHLLEIAGATVGLIGVGSIGRRVARMAAALGMHVIAIREHVEKGCPEGVERVYPPSELGKLLSQSDYVVVAAPLLPVTTGLIGAQQLAGMKPDGFLINVGRGPQVDEQALVEALQTRRIAGAALDVFDREPLPPDSPLWGLDNLLITPHTAGLTGKIWQRHYQLLSSNLRRYLAHEPLEGVVDKHRGY